MIKSFLLKHEVHMTRPVWMPLQKLQQLTHWTVRWNRIRHRHNRLEPEIAIRVASQHRSALWRFSILVLDIIKPLAICLPYINFYVLDRFAVSILDGAEN